nr:uncharacterized protein LOC111504320 isoform X3 [Leptinotarsa decemlineata]
MNHLGLVPMDVSDEVSNEVPIENEVPIKDEVCVKNEVLNEVDEKANDTMSDKEFKEDHVKLDDKVSDKIADKVSDEIADKVSDEIVDKVNDTLSDKVSADAEALEKLTDEASKPDLSTNLVLTEDIVKLLKCSLCNQYLSYPPVYIISEVDAKYKCGRCTIYTRFKMRAVMYENLAKFMKFPCIYKGCPLKIEWEEVREHERNCKYRTLICIAPDCVEHVMYDKFAAHFKEKHIKFFQTNTMIRENVHTKTGMVVLEKEDKCYVVFFDNDVDRFRISVCSFGTADKQFEMVFGSKEKPHSIIVSEQNIVPFNEKVHCYKCLLGECKYNFHIYRNNRKGILKHVHTKIDREMIKRTFGGSTVTCTVNVVDEKIEAEDELDELLMGKDVIIDEVNDDEEVEKVVKEEENSALSNMLKCPSCEEQMAPPIYECLSGHTMCNSCKVKSEKCSSCEAQIENTRNYILEEVVANLKLVGQEKTEKVEISDDEITCPVAKCHEKVKLQAISNHFKENHITNFHFNNLMIKDVYGYYNVDVLVKDGKTYLIFFDFDDCSFGISVCSLEPDQHRYEVKLQADNKKYSIISTNQKIILFNDKEHCAKCSIGLNMEMLPAVKELSINCINYNVSYLGQVFLRFTLCNWHNIDVEYLDSGFIFWFALGLKDVPS